MAIAFSIIKFSVEMLTHINSLATVIGSLLMIGGFGLGIWRVSIYLYTMHVKVNQTVCQVSALEVAILEKLETMQISAEESQAEQLRRFDEISRKLHYLFGRTNTTIPPKD